MKTWARRINYHAPNSCKNTKPMCLAAFMHGGMACDIYEGNCSYLTIIDIALTI